MFLQHREDGAVPALCEQEPVWQISMKRQAYTTERFLIGRSSHSTVMVAPFLPNVYHVCDVCDRLSSSGVYDNVYDNIFRYD